MLRSIPLALALCAPVLAGNDGWVADYDAGVALAQKEGKNLLVDFTGSDWCGWCVRLDKEVFSHEIFKQGVKDGYVLVSLDFPRSEELQAKVPNPERNQELFTKYNCSGYPTILLMTPEGDVFGRTGYQEGGPEAYLAHMAELEKTGMAQLDEVKKLVAELDQAGADARAEVWGKVVARLEASGGDAVGAERLVGGVKQALRFDADNAAGLKRKAVDVLLSLGRVDDDVFAAAKGLDGQNEEGLYETALVAVLEKVADEEGVKRALPLIADYVAVGTFKDKEKAFFVHVLGAWWSDKILGKHEDAVGYANKGLALGVGDPGMIQALNEILSHEHGDDGDGDGGDDGGDDDGGDDDDGDDGGDDGGDDDGGDDDDGDDGGDDDDGDGR